MKKQDLIVGKLYKYDQPAEYPMEHLYVHNGDILRYVDASDLKFVVVRGDHTDMVVHLLRLAIQFLTELD